MIFTEQEYETLLYAVNATNCRSKLTAGTYNRLSALKEKLTVMREMEKTVRTKKAMRDMLDSLCVQFGPNTNMYPGLLMDAADNMEILLEELGGT